jgi:hypothetical protein
MAAAGHAWVYVVAHVPGEDWLVTYNLNVVHFSSNRLGMIGTGTGHLGTPSALLTRMALAFGGPPTLAGSPSSTGLCTLVGSPGSVWPSEASLRLTLTCSPVPVQRRSSMVPLRLTLTGSPGPGHW